MQEISHFRAGLEGKCPRCHKGRIFTFPLWKIWKFYHTNESCSNCQLKYEVEPGFFYGAMYISYAINVAILITEGVLLYWLDLLKGNLIFYLVPSTVIFLLPFIFRFSRMIFLYWFGGIKYDKKRQ